MKKLLTMLVATIISMSLLSSTVICTAASSNQSVSSGTALQGQNINVNGCLISERWGESISTYIATNKDGTISTVDAVGHVSVCTYSSDGNLLSSKSIEYELPKFGCFLSGKDYNYIAFGKDNLDESDTAEVIRIVRYDKNFKRIGSISVSNCYTVIPFDAGTPRMAENGDDVILHTSRERYLTEDGLHHQSQLTVIADISTMTVTNNLGKFQDNHVGHSFNQFVLFDNDNYVLLDHGDAYPRSVVLSKGDSAPVDVFDIPGKIGANCTGVCVGGFEASSSSYIAAINTVDHTQITEYDSFEIYGSDITHRNVLLCVLPKSSLNKASVKQITLQKYVGTHASCSAPNIVKITDSKFLVMWNEYDNWDSRVGEFRGMKYVFVNQDGDPISDILYANGLQASSCQPVMAGDGVAWVFSDDGIRYLAFLSANENTSAPPYFDSFISTRSYIAGQFDDVNENAWYGAQQQGAIKTVYELSIMSGSGNRTFNPNGNTKICEAVKMAAIVHNKFCGGEGAFIEGSPWYQVYFDYANENNIFKDTGINAGYTYNNGSNPESSANRRQMAILFYNAAGLSHLEQINNPFNIPDVNSGRDAKIYRLFLAGILSGDQNGKFNGSSNITRAEAAAIVSRIAIPERRIQNLY